VRIGVLYPDGSINVMRAWRDHAQTLAEARAERDRWNEERTGGATVVALVVTELERVT
jgi:hypothetical protein